MINISTLIIFSQFKYDYLKNINNDDNFNGVEYLIIITKKERIFQTTPLMSKCKRYNLKLSDNNK